MKPTYPLYPFHLENVGTIGDFDDNFHGNLRDRMRESPLLLQEAAIAVLESFSDRHFSQIGPYYNPLVYVGIDIKLDLHLHCRTILAPKNRDALALLLPALRHVTGATYIRFLYGDFPGDCAIAQWNFAQQGWNVNKS